MRWTGFNVNTRRLICHLFDMNLIEHWEMPPHLGAGVEDAVSRLPLWDQPRRSGFALSSPSRVDIRGNLCIFVLLSTEHVVTVCNRIDREPVCYEKVNGRSVDRPTRAFTNHRCFFRLYGSVNSDV